MKDLRVSDWQSVNETEFRADDLRRVGSSEYYYVARLYGVRGSKVNICKPVGGFCAMLQCHLRSRPSP